MKKISKSNLIMILTGVSCIFLIIGGYLAFTGMAAKQNQESIINQLNKANETNKGLQDNLKTLKELLVKEQSDSSSDGPTVIYANESDSVLDINEGLDSITGTYFNEKYPRGLDVSTINYLDGYGINAYTIKFAYEDKLRTEGYPEELNGYGLLQQVELIDSHTCVVKLSGAEDDLRIMYTLEYDLGIKFVEIKKEITTRLNVNISNFDMSLQNSMVAITARYDMETLELMDSQFMLRHNMIDYSPDGKYMTIISYDPRALYSGYRNSNDFKPKLVVKDLVKDIIVYEEILVGLRYSLIQWSPDSQRFILQNTLYYDLNDIKSRDLKTKSENYQLAASTITKEYIVNFGIEVVEDGLNLFVCKIYDWDLNLIEELLLFETNDDFEQYSDLESSYHPLKLYENTIEFNYYTENDVETYLVEINPGHSEVTEIVSNLERYTYISELNLKAREVSNSQGSTLIFEDVEGNELFKTEYPERILFGYLGADAESQEIYFTRTTSEEIIEDEIIDEYSILVYNIDEDSFSEKPVPTDHINANSMVDTMLNWPRSYSQGILEVYTIIPLDKTNN